jgi:hypothetical protein
MLHSISDAKTHSVKFLADFFKNATIEEKIDAFYIQIEIRRQSLVFRKSGHKLTGVDLILNADYSTLMKEWEMLRHVNQDWFQEHIGYTISLFFLPVPKPLTVEYPSDVRYIVDRVSRWKVDEDIKDTMTNLNMLDEFCVRFKHELIKKPSSDPSFYLEFAKRFKNGHVSDDELIATLVETSTVFAVDKPEGFIIKMGKKHIFQTASPEHHTVDMSERTQYEYLLIDFSSFWNSIDDIYGLIGNSDYVHIVCTLFNAYYEWQLTKPLKDSIDASGIEPPCLGYKPETGFKNIPNMKTVQICKRSRLMENAFKVLLVNLRKYKRPEHCVLMTENHIAAWNSIVKTLQNALVC